MLTRSYSRSKNVTGITSHLALRACSTSFSSNRQISESSVSAIAGMVREVEQSLLHSTTPRIQVESSIHYTTISIPSPSVFPFLTKDKDGHNEGRSRSVAASIHHASISNRILPVSRPFLMRMESISQRGTGFSPSAASSWILSGTDPRPDRLL
jgi:hypothetical protein